MNTDAIDNSAGVDTSDHEVNLKILLALPQQEGELPEAERDALLASVTEQVAEHVLRDNELQTAALTAELHASQAALESYESVMVDLEASGALDRDVEVLPSPPEMERRREAGAGLTRPELAVLLGYAKVDLSTEVLDSALPEDPYLESVLAGYFPAPIVERFARYLQHHRLRRELIATVLANDLVNRLGITYANRTAHELGVTPAQVTAAYWIARQVSDADAHWRAVEALEGRVEPAAQLELKSEIDRLVDAFVRSYLRHPTAGLGDAVARDRPAFDELEKAIGKGELAVRRNERRIRVEHYADLGVAPEVAERVVALGDLALVPDVAAVARTTGQPVRHVAEAFVRLTQALPLDRLGRRLRTVVPQGHWERWQHRGLLDDLRDLRRRVARLAITAYPEAMAPEAVERYLAEHDAHSARITTMLAHLDREAGAGLAAIAVAVRTLREILDD